MMTKILYYNGNLISVNDQEPSAEALLIVHGRIAAIGSNEAVLSLKDEETQMVNLEGKTILPGFIDPHGHIASHMNRFVRFDPSPVGQVDSIEQLIQVGQKSLAGRQLSAEQWFIGMGYDNSFFKDNLPPTKEQLDEISDQYPIVIYHISGHVAVANSKALAIAGITKDTPQPEGGVIQKDAKTGEPTGVLEEKATHILSAYSSKGESVEGAAHIFVQTQKYYAGFGITTAQDGLLRQSALESIRYCQDHDLMVIDVYAYAGLETARELLDGINSLTAKYDRHFKIAGAKVVADGSPQAKTAWLSEPYYQVPSGEALDYKAYPIYTDGQVYDFMKDCLVNNWQVLHHCNGDATGDQFIKLYEKAQQETGRTTDLRPVMVHAQTVREDQLDDMKRLGILPSFFHDHTFYWGDYHLDSVLGPIRGRRISPLKSALDRGMNFTLHQDSPIVPPNMIFAIHNAVNRQTRSGRTIGEEFAIGVMDAIKAVTINGAYQCFEEASKGSLEVGKLGDLVILDKNPLTVPKEEIKNILVLETIKEGKTVFKKEG